MSVGLTPGDQAAEISFVERHVRQANRCIRVSSVRVHRFLVMNVTPQMAGYRHPQCRADLIVARTSYDAPRVIHDEEIFS